MCQRASPAQCSGFHSCSQSWCGECCGNSRRCLGQELKKCVKNIFVECCL